MADTDGDGVLDGQEVYQGSDPKLATSKPAINLLVNGNTAVTPVSSYGTDLLEIKLEDSSGGILLMYSIDGTDPIAGSGIVYNGPFNINEPLSIRAVSLDSSFNKVAELKPVTVNILPVTSKVVEENNTYLKLNSSDADSTIYYALLNNHTKLLIHSNENNGADDFVDSSASKHTISKGGSGTQHRSKGNWS